MSAHELLDAWEQGLGQPAHERALRLLAACNGGDVKALSCLSIGHRDRALLELRAAVFGPRLASLAACPACGERMEMEMKVDDLLVKQHDEQPASLTLRAGDYDVRFRLPNSNDLADLASWQDATGAAHALLVRCIISARLGDEEVPAAQLPSEVLEAVEERMGEADPQGDMRLALNCSACGQAWQAAFDIGQFLWGELNSWAARTLDEIHSLAKAYGWREADILALSPQRRQLYLKMVG